MQVPVPLPVRASLQHPPPVRRDQPQKAIVCQENTMHILNLLLAVNHDN